MIHYFHDFWDLYGLTPLTVWDLPFNDFIPMTSQADQARAERAKNNGG